MYIIPQYKPGDIVILRAARILSHGGTTVTGPCYWVEFADKKRVLIGEQTIYKKAERKDEPTKTKVG
jgi:hypothetical protein